MAEIPRTSARGVPSAALRQWTGGADSSVARVPVAAATAVHRVVTLRTEPGRGAPDEAHPTIAIATRAVTVARATRWGSDEHPDSDPVSAYLLGIRSGTGAWESVHGVSDREWRPEGLDRPA